MSDVVVTVTLELEVYEKLLTAANEADLTVADMAGGIVENYMEENYGEV